MSSMKELDSTLDPALVEQLVMAAVAAAAAAASLPPTPTSTVATTPELLKLTDSNTQQTTLAQITTASNTSQQQPGASSKNSITEKVRQDNRERKKRWRLHNQERNKDNDLRCRVNKRAVKLFGKEDSPHKQKWIEEEFEKRRSKRREKEERRKSHTPTVSDLLPNVLAEPYITLLAANALTTTTTTTTEENKPEQFAAQLLEFLQQQQQQQQQSQEFTQSENTTVVSEMVTEETPVKQVNENTEDTEQVTAIEEKAKVVYPADAVMTLMQLNAGWRQ